MTLGQYIRMILTQDLGVAALASDRVYSEVLPQAPKTPAVVFTEIAADEDYSFDGPTGVRRTSLLVESWAEKRVNATALGIAVKRALSGHSGAAGGFDVQSCFFVTERWAFDSETNLYRTSQDYEVWASGEDS